MKCLKYEKIFDTILKLEDPEKLENDELQHFQTCQSCMETYQRIIDLEKQIKLDASKQISQIPRMEFEFARLKPEKLPVNSSLKNIFEITFARPLFIALAVLVLLATGSLLIFTGSFFPNNIAADNLGNTQKKARIIEGSAPLHLYGKELSIASLTEIRFPGVRVVSAASTFVMTQNQFVLKTGEMRFSVDKGTNLTVLTPDVRIKVIGTVFSVSVASQGTLLKVEQGRVLAENANSGQKILCEPGFEAVFSSPKTKTDSQNSLRDTETIASPPLAPEILGPDNGESSETQGNASFTDKTQEHQEETQENWSEVTLDDALPQNN